MPRVLWPTTTTIRHGLLLVLIVTIASPCAGFSVTDCSDPLRLCATSTQTEHQQQQQQPSPTAPWREIERVEDHPKESSRLCMECFHPGEQPAGIEMMQRKENRNDQNYSDAPRLQEVQEHSSSSEAQDEATAAAASAKDDAALLERHYLAQSRVAPMAKQGRGLYTSKAAARDTSVGARPVGSVTRSRQGGSAASQVLNGVRNTSLGASATSEHPPKRGMMHVSSLSSTATTVAARISHGVVTTAIEELLQSRSSSVGQNLRPHQNGLLPSTHSVSNPVSIRLATPQDDVDIANLRLSVFSDFTTDLQSQFCARSCQAIAARRRHGAICLVATKPSRTRSAIAGMCASDIIVGSVECSWHEFCGTRLGRRRLPHAIWYVTEVAVSPSTRRQKIGSQLLEAIDVYAQNRCVETLYLHVDVANRGALRMYEKAGYLNLSSKSHDRDNYDDSMHLEFTKSLNLHPGATKGREHFLLYKNLVEESTWLDDSHVNDGTLDGSSHSSSRSNELVNVLGFDIPA